MCEEIDDASTLQDFMDVVGLWSQDSVRVGAATVILKRIVDFVEKFINGMTGK